MDRFFSLWRTIALLIFHRICVSQPPQKMETLSRALATKGMIRRGARRDRIMSKKNRNKEGIIRRYGLAASGGLTAKRENVVLRSMQDEGWANICSKHGEVLWSSWQVAAEIRASIALTLRILLDSEARA